MLQNSSYSSSEILKSLDIPVIHYYERNVAYFIVHFWFYFNNKKFNETTSCIVLFVALFNRKHSFGIWLGVGWNGTKHKTDENKIKFNFVLHSLESQIIIIMLIIIMDWMHGLWLKMANIKFVWLLLICIWELTIEHVIKSI